MPNYFYWSAVAVAVLGLICGTRDERRIFVPHAGYTWSAVAFMLVYIGLK